MRSVEQTPSIENAIVLPVRSGSLTNREILVSLIEFARSEAADDGEVLCSQLLDAALMALDLDDASLSSPGSDPAMNDALFDEMDRVSATLEGKLDAWDAILDQVDDGRRAFAARATEHGGGA